MSNAAKSIFAFGIYLFGLGAILVVIPNTLFAWFGLPNTSEVWIRVVGMLLLFLAFYDVQAARKEMIEFFRWTTFARSTVIVFLVAFVLLGLVDRQLILFGFVDMLGAIWTTLALRSARTSH